MPRYPPGFPQDFRYSVTASINHCMECAHYLKTGCAKGHDRITKETKDCADYMEEVVINENSVEMV